MVVVPFEEESNLTARVPFEIFLQTAVSAIVSVAVGRGAEDIYRDATQERRKKSPQTPRTQKQRHREKTNKLFLLDRGVFA